MKSILGYASSLIPGLAIAFACSSDDHSLGKDKQTQTRDAGSFREDAGAVADGSSEPPVEGTGGRDGAGGRTGSGGATPGTGGATPGSGGTDNCEEPFYAQAEALIAQHNECTEDAECEVVLLDEATCFAGCGVALHPSTDVGGLNQDLTTLSDEFLAECGTCPVPECGEQPPDAVCNAENRCELDWGTCESQYYAEVEALVDQYNSCSEDAECGIVHVNGADCVSGCGSAINVTLDAADSVFPDALRRIHEDLLDACGEGCPVPSCAQPEGVVCNAESKCEVLYE